MTNKHPNDIEIQQFVLNEKDCDPGTPEHIRSCEHCNVKAEEYKLLIKEIENQETPAFDFDLADLVMEQLPAPKPKVLPDKLFWRFITVVTVLPILTVFFVSGNTLLGLLGNVAPLIVALIVITVLGILAFLSIDMYRKYQARIKALNLN